MSPLEQNVLWQSLISQISELLQCHPGNMWPKIVIKQNYDQASNPANKLTHQFFFHIKPSFKLQSQILKGVIEN